jgi:hypothetical protein
MAIVTLKNVTVQFVNSGKGIKVLEESTSGDRTFKQQYTVWVDAGHPHKVGDVLPEVQGLLGAKQGKPWTDRDGNERQSIELSVNNPRITSDQPF